MFGTKYSGVIEERVFFAFDQTFAMIGLEWNGLVVKEKRKTSRRRKIC